MLVNVAVNLPLKGFFTYEAPTHLKSRIAIGTMVVVEFRRRMIAGCVVGLEKTPPLNLKPIIDVIADEPVFDERKLKFLKWLASYYIAPLGEVMSLVYPPSIKINCKRVFELTEKGKEYLTENQAGIKPKRRVELLNAIKEKTLLKTLDKNPGKDASIIKGLKRGGLIREVLHFKGIRGKARPVGAAGEENIEQTHEGEHEPNKAQGNAIKEISEGLDKGFSPYLLCGVTGSGKTLVYLNIIKKVLESGKRALYMLPEIALTEKVSAHVRGMFPGRVSIVHSAMTQGRRRYEWQRILEGKADVVVGPRSALFSPIKDLGVIIVDEEHDPSYKEEGGIRYNARDAALMLGKTLGITVVLGSATPAMETYYNAKKGKLKLLSMGERVRGGQMPEVEILYADMRKSRGAILSDRLVQVMKETLSRGSQALLFLNRRGFSDFLICRDCSRSVGCRNCSVALKLHKKAGSLICHYCGLAIAIPEVCPACGSYNMASPGAGTQKVEEEARRLFPENAVVRLDRDSASEKGSIKKIMEEVETGRADILVGTQMVAKGHHFPGITFVGIISGDTSLNIPDFRSAERTFQLIAQASGRAGRGGSPSTVLIQTLNPAHFAFRHALRHDYDGFFNEELKLREEAHYPPATRLASLRVEGIKETNVVDAALRLKNICEDVRKKSADITLLGPSEAFLYRLKGRLRRQMLVKCGDAHKLNRFLTLVKDRFEGARVRGATLIIDVDPATTV